MLQCVHFGCQLPDLPAKYLHTLFCTNDHCSINTLINSDFQFSYLSIEFLCTYNEHTTGHHKNDTLVVLVANLFLQNFKHLHCYVPLGIIKSTHEYRIYTHTCHNIFTEAMCISVQCDLCTTLVHVKCVRLVTMKFYKKKILFVIHGT
jgi:hypothetical protein